MIVHGWHLPDNDTYFQNILINEFASGRTPDYQLPHRFAAINATENRRVVIDIGSHLGFWSRHFGEIFETVHSFEPSDLYSNLLSLNAPKSIIHKYALGDKEDEGYLFVPDVNSGAAFIAHSIKGHQKIVIRTLDSFNFEMVDLIKIDCEGYEYPVILGAIETIKKCSPVICLEQKKGVIGRYDEKQDQYKSLEFLIQKLGYSVVDRVVDDWVLKKTD
jgi:FkbM family methyltransferase